MHVHGTGYCCHVRVFFDVSKFEFLFQPMSGTFSFWRERQCNITLITKKDDENLLSALNYSFPPHHTNPQKKTNPLSG